MNQTELFENNNASNLKYTINCRFYDLNLLTKFCSLSKIFQGHKRSIKVIQGHMNFTTRSEKFF